MVEAASMKCEIRFSRSSIRLFFLIPIATVVEDHGAILVVIDVASVLDDVVTNSAVVEKLSSDVSTVVLGCCTDVLSASVDVGSDVSTSSHQNKT